METRNRHATLLSLLLVLAVGPAHAQDPAMFQAALGDPVWLPGGREVCWSEPAQGHAAKISAEVISAKGWSTEVANDFMLYADGYLTKAIFYGGPFGLGTTDSTALAFVIRFYDEAVSGDKHPAELIWSIQDAGDPERVGADGYGFPILKYEVSIGVCVQANERYWMSVAATDHAFTTQWGRTCTGYRTLEESVIRSSSFGSLEWVPLGEVLGYPEDVAYELEAGASTGGDYDPCETATRRSTWGAVRALFR